MINWLIDLFLVILNSGIVAGSIAASWEASAVSGGLFAILESAGVAGISSATAAAIGTALGATAAAITSALSGRKAAIDDKELIVEDVVRPVSAEEIPIVKVIEEKVIVEEPVFQVKVSIPSNAQVLAEPSPVADEIDIEEIESAIIETDEPLKDVADVQLVEEDISEEEGDDDFVTDE